MAWNVSPISDSSIYLKQAQQQQAARPMARLQEASPVASMAKGGTANAPAAPVATDRVSRVTDSAVAQQIATLVQTQRAANRTVSMAQTADGGLQEIGSLLTRMRELAVEATSETITPAQRTDVDADYRALQAQAQAVVRNTRYDGEPLLQGGVVARGFGTKWLPGLDTSLHLRHVADGELRTRWSSTLALMAIDQTIADVGSMRTHLRSSFSLQGPTIRTLQQQVDLAGADATTADTAYAIATNALVSAHIQQNAARLVAMVANQMPTAALALLYFNGAANEGR